MRVITPQGLRAAPGLPQLALLLGVLVLLLAAACTPQAELTLEEQAQRLEASLMCPQCDGQTVDQSNAPAAIAIRAIIRERLAAGDTPAEIKAYLMEDQRYGLQVLAAPPREGFHLLAWLVPPLVVAMAATALVLVLRAMRHGGGVPNASSPPAVAPGTLEPYLAAVDRELEAGELHRRASGLDDSPSRRAGHEETERDRG